MGSETGSVDSKNFSCKAKPQKVVGGWKIFWAPTSMYCGVSIANDAIRQQSKKEWGSGCLTAGAGGNPDSIFSHGVPAMWKFWRCQKICGCCEWEFTVNSHPRSAQFNNVVTLQATFKCSNFCDPDIIWYTEKMGTMSYHCSHCSFFSATGNFPSWGETHCALTCSV